jgi:hypothetical protein
VELLYMNYVRVMEGGCRGIGGATGIESLY